MARDTANHMGNHTGAKQKENEEEGENGKEEGEIGKEEGKEKEDQYSTGPAISVGTLATQPVDAQCWERVSKAIVTRVG